LEGVLGEMHTVEAGMRGSFSVQVAGDSLEESRKSIEVSQIGIAMGKQSINESKRIKMCKFQNPVTPFVACTF
jgi:hypothetical protein